MAVSTFILLYNQHHHPSPELFHHPKINSSHETLSSHSSSSFSPWKPPVVIFLIKKTLKRQPFFLFGIFGINRCWEGILLLEKVRSSWPPDTNPLPELTFTDFLMSGRKHQLVNFSPRLKTDLPFNFFFFFLFMKGGNMEVESTERISKDVREAISPAGRGGALQGAGNILYLDLWVVYWCRYM